MTEYEPATGEWVQTRAGTNRDYWLAIRQQVGSVTIGDLNTPPFFAGIAFNTSGHAFLLFIAQDESLGYVVRYNAPSGPNGYPLPSDTVTDDFTLPVGYYGLTHMGNDTFAARNATGIIRFTDTGTILETIAPRTGRGSALGINEAATRLYVEYANTMYRYDLPTAGELAGATNEVALGVAAGAPGDVYAEGGFFYHATQNSTAGGGIVQTYASDDLTSQPIATYQTGATTTLAGQTGRGFHIQPDGLACCILNDQLLQIAIDVATVDPDGLLPPLPAGSEGLPAEAQAPLLSQAQSIMGSVITGGVTVDAYRSDAPESPPLVQDRESRHDEAGATWQVRVANESTLSEVDLGVLGILYEVSNVTVYAVDQNGETPQELYVSAGGTGGTFTYYGYDDPSAASGPRSNTTRRIRIAFDIVESLTGLVLLRHTGTTVQVTDAGLALGIAGQGSYREGITHHSYNAEYLHSIEALDGPDFLTKTRDAIPHYRDTTTAARYLTDQPAASTSSLQVPFLALDSVGRFGTLRSPIVGASTSRGQHYARDSLRVDLPNALKATMEYRTGRETAVPYDAGVRIVPTDANLWSNADAGVAFGARRTLPIRQGIRQRVYLRATADFSVTTTDLRRRKAVGENVYVLNEYRDENNDPVVGLIVERRLYDFNEVLYTRASPLVATSGTTNAQGFAQAANAAFWNVGTPLGAWVLRHEQANQNLDGGGTFNVLDRITEEVVQLEMGDTLNEFPVGAIVAFAQKNAPVGWLPCIGQQIDATVYPELALAVSDTYGPIAGNLYTLPDTRDRALVGAISDLDIGTKEAGSVTVLFPETETGPPSQTHLVALNIILNEETAHEDHTHTVPQQTLASNSDVIPKNLRVRHYINTARITQTAIIFGRVHLTRRGTEYRVRAQRLNGATYEGITPQRVVVEVRGSFDEQLVLTSFDATQNPLRSEEYTFTYDAGNQPRTVAVYVLTEEGNVFHTSHFIDAGTGDAGGGGETEVVQELIATAGDLSDPLRWERTFFDSTLRTQDDADTLATQLLQASDEQISVIVDDNRSPATFRSLDEYTLDLDDLPYSGTYRIVRVEERSDDTSRLYLGAIPRTAYDQERDLTVRTSRLERSRS